jgi:hypothetical protein
LNVEFIENWPQALAAARHGKSDRYLSEPWRVDLFDLAHEVDEKDRLFAPQYR